jgi:hypothetical protein
MGFWSADCVVRKLARLRHALLGNLIRCLDESRASADGALPADARVLRFHRRVDSLAGLGAAGVAPGDPP